MLRKTLDVCRNTRRRRSRPRPDPAVLHPLDEQLAAQRRHDRMASLQFSPKVVAVTDEFRAVGASKCS